jgi:hypothetical protein
MTALYELEVEDESYASGLGSQYGRSAPGKEAKKVKNW